MGNVSREPDPSRHPAAPGEGEKNILDLVTRFPRISVALRSDGQKGQSGLVI
jgi:hypothetical protein